MARRIHIVPVEDESNGVWRVANMLAAEDGGTVQLGCGGLDDAEEVWVHGMWLPREWRACWRALRLGKRLVRMTHGSLSPVYLRYHGWKKWLVGPIERYFLRRADRIVATCAAEKGWIEAYLGKRCPVIEVTDIKRFFDLNHAEHVDRVEGDGSLEFRVSSLELGEGKSSHVERVEHVEGGISSHKERKERKGDGSLHLLYLGRRHPLKGLEYLEKAVKSLEFPVSSLEFGVKSLELGESKTGRVERVERRVELRVVSNAFGEEKEKVWEWCDVLVLPTLSENFGLVVAEALERGKRVITTDGAPAWGGEVKVRVEGEGGSRVDGGERNSHVEHVDHVEGVESLEFRVQSLEFGGEIWSGYGGRLLYLVGYRDGSEDERVRLLKEAIERVV